jgi:hypothetical protein
MWVVILGCHYVYLQNEESRFETKNHLLALTVYWSFYIRYLFSIYPEKYVKIYRIENNVVDLRKYRIDYQGRGRYAKGSRHSKSGKTPRKV